MIDFVEIKHIDFNAMEDVLGSSEQANHWTNFGPVSDMLELKLDQCFNLHREKSVIVCSSGTEALFCLVKMHNFISGTPLRWVVSSFGFYCSHQGPLCDAKIIDCDKNAILDLSLLNPNDFDGMVLTNPFGVLDNLNEHKKYCDDHNKVLICDSGSAFNATNHNVDEAISLHHTKPWGFGEGGCIVVDRKNKDLMKSIINFGKGSSKKIKRISTNAKISDISCACILQRLENLQEIKRVGIEQYNRIVKIANNFDFMPLIKRPISHIPHCVPLLHEKPIYSPNNPHLKIHKYYEPLDGSLIANDTYKRIINIPCHRDVERINDSVLKSIFNFIRKEQR